MTSYLLAYRQPLDFEPGQPERIAAWQTFFAGLDSRLEELGNPVFARRAVGNTGAGTALGGYTIITADSLDEAVELMSNCPLLAAGGGVEVGEITPLDAATMTANSGSVATTR